MGYRRKAREAALQLLYTWELTGELTSEDIREIWNLKGQVNPKVQDFAILIFNGVMAHLQEIDEHIQAASLNWRVERMSLIDRNILRIAVLEILYFRDIPFRVSLDEAIEIGKKFGTGDSGAFINGVLDRIVNNMRKDK